MFEGEGKVSGFPGNYSDYRVYEFSQPKTTQPKKKEIASITSNKAEKLSYNEQKELKNLESKIRSLELDKKALEAQFNNTELSQDEINTLSEQLQDIINDIETKEARWFELSEKLEG